MKRKSSHQLDLFLYPDSKILILGSFPSVKSMETNFYYMHPQNRFYKVLNFLLGDNFYNATIDVKKELLRKYHIALYDVIESCEIEGSSDSKIKNVVPTNMKKLLEKSNIEHIFINGSKAYELFKKYDSLYLSMASKLPSTSPANARMKVDDLANEWKEILKYIKE